MYSLFINSVLIESSNDFDVLVRKRYSSILEFLKDGYKFVNDSDAKEYNNNSVIELSKDNDIKKLSILWSGNTVEDITEENTEEKSTENTIDKDVINDTVENSNEVKDIEDTKNIDNVKNLENIENIEDNADTIEDQNKNMGLNLDDDLDSNDDDSSEENDSIIINDSNNLSNTISLNNEESISNSQQTNTKSNINSIKNSIINTIVSALQTLEYDSAFIPSKTFAQQIQNLFNNPEYITYKQQFITSILAGKSEHEIIIPIKQNDNLVNIYTLCYILITRGYQFNLSVDDEYNLHIQITW